MNSLLNCGRFRFRARVLPWAAAAQAILALGLVVLTAVAQACNVPVFRYALERWRSDAYQVVVFHRGPLTAGQQAEIAPLAELQDLYKANIFVRTVDVDELADKFDQQLWEAVGRPEALPHLAVGFPAHLRIPVPVWSAPLGRESVAALSDSPARREIVRRLAAGQTAVWVLIECGDATKDKAAGDLLAEQLPRLQAELKLPELTAAPDDTLLASTPLKVGFSVLRVARGNPAEQPLVQMFVRSEPDLAERNDPLVFPVFGRGRALFGLVGAGITADNMYDCAAFLVGACSCEVKELNPGFDLLLAAEWDRLLFEDGPPLSVMTRRPPDPADEPVLVPIPGGSAQRSAPEAAATRPTAAPRPEAAASYSPPRNEHNATILLIGGVGFALALFLIACLAGMKR